MSMRKGMQRILLLSLIIVSPSLANESPGLGVPVSEAEIAATNFVVMPNGEGLPEGSGDSIRGAYVYQENCLVCHGVEGKDGINDVLVGGHGTITKGVPNKTVGSFWPYATTLFDYVRRAMPYTAPGSLSSDDIYAVTAYLLFLNDIVEETDEMNAVTLPAVHMPNRDNFVWGYSPQ
jgi:cytochrome c